MNTSATLPSSFTDSMNASIITGIATFSSKSEPMPPRPAVVTTASLPITRHATMIIDSAITGFTLPGMIELPGCVSGSSSSKMPHRGPLPSQRMSLAIFVSETAIVFSSPWAATNESFAAWASSGCRPLES